MFWWDDEKWRNVLTLLEKRIACGNKQRNQKDQCFDSLMKKEKQFCFFFKCSKQRNKKDQCFNKMMKKKRKVLSFLKENQHAAVKK